jgi:hypothetical protein
MGRRGHAAHQGLRGPRRQGVRHRRGLHPHRGRSERSSASHRHYFAAVYDAWLNLPEIDAERFPTADHLRKYALIRAGYCDTRELVCASKAEAVRVGAFMKPMDPYALVAISGAVVRVYTAKSQAPGDGPQGVPGVQGRRSRRCCRGHDRGVPRSAPGTWDGILLRAVLWPVVALIILGAVIGS